MQIKLFSHYNVMKNHVMDQERTVCHQMSNTSTHVHNGRTQGLAKDE